MGLAASLVLLGFEVLFPSVPIFHDLSLEIRRIDFSEAVLDGMLGFLLFAGALHVDLSALHEQRWTVGAMATIGVCISTERFNPTRPFRHV